MLLCPTLGNVEEQCTIINGITNIKSFRKYLETTCLHDKVDDIRCETGETCYVVIPNATYDFGIPGVEVDIMSIKILSIRTTKIELDDGTIKYGAIITHDIPKPTSDVAIEGLLFKSKEVAEILSDKIKELGPMANVEIFDMIDCIRNNLVEVKTKSKPKKKEKKEDNIKMENELEKIFSEATIVVKNKVNRFSKLHSTIKGDRIPIIRVVEISSGDNPSEAYKDSTIYLSSPEQIINSYNDVTGYHIMLNIEYDNPNLDVVKTLKTIGKRIENIATSKISDSRIDSFLTNPALPAPFEKGNYMTTRSFFSKKNQSVIYKLYGYGNTPVDSMENVLHLSSWIRNNYKNIDTL